MLKAPHSAGGLKCLLAAPLFWILAVLGPIAAAAAADLPTVLDGPVPQAAPTAPPIQHQSGILGLGGQGPKPMVITLYSIGQPTDEEQLYLEYLNRMRANPNAEGQRLAAATDPNVLSAYSYYGVDLNLMQYDFSTNVPAPPLAFNANLINAARWHSGDMFTNQYQGHYQTNGGVVLDPGQRMMTNGYYWWADGENVFSYAQSVFHGHAGFAVDWGYGIGGMQDPAGHRMNMMDESFREIGVGVVDGVNGPVGPQLVTQDFGVLFANQPFITGVVYYDLNGNGFYDVGEGIGGVTVNVSGSSYYAVTPDSGGYTIPVTSDGNYTVTFSDSGLYQQTVVAVTGQRNVKVDYIPGYSPPVISGPNPAYVNQCNLYAFSAVGGATGYQCEQSFLVPYTAVEGAENGLTNVTVVISPGYAVITNDIKASGNCSFHLAHAPDPINPNDQILTLNPVLLLGTNSQLTFAKQIGMAFSNEVSRAQISTNGGAVWQDVWSQPGNDGTISVDSTFVRITNSLSAFAGRIAQVRFVFAYLSGHYYLPSSGVGLYLDDIAVSNAQQITNPSTNSLTATPSFCFSPTNTGNYLLMVRAQINSRTLNWGPPLQVTAVPAIVMNSPVLASSQVQLNFTISPSTTGVFNLLQVDQLGAAWTTNTSAMFTTNVPGTSYRFTTTPGTAARYYRVVKVGS
jgi:hypothetical protein